VAVLSYDSKIRADRVNGERLAAATLTYLERGRDMAEIPDIVAAIQADLASGDDTAWGEGRLHLSDLGYSSTGGGCKRALWLRLQGEEQNPPSLGLRWLWARGHEVEAAILAALQNSLAAGWSVSGSQVKCQFLGIKGTLDILLEHEDGTKCVVECKSARGNAFSRLKVEPKQAHVLQASAYALGVGADLALIIYADREGQNGFIQWEVEIDGKMVVNAIKEIKAVQALLETDKEFGYEPPLLRPSVTVKENKGPDSVYLKEPWQCAYCSFRDVSCKGAISHLYRRSLPDSGLIGHLQPDGSIKPKGDVAPVLVDIARAGLVAENPKDGMP
jgi:hypothetical protein